MKQVMGKRKIKSDIYFFFNKNIASRQDDFISVLINWHDENNFIMPKMWFSVSGSADVNLKSEVTPSLALSY